MATSELIVEATIRTMTQTMFSMLEQTGRAAGMVELLRDNERLGLVMTMWRAPSPEGMRHVKDRTWELLGEWFAQLGADAIVDAQDAWIAKPSGDDEARAAAGKRIDIAGRADKQEGLIVQAFTDVTEQGMTIRQVLQPYERHDGKIVLLERMSKPKELSGATFQRFVKGIGHKNKTPLDRIPAKLEKLGHAVLLPGGEG